jgi:hypothetical protein
MEQIDRKSPLDEEVIRQCMHSILKAVEYIHKYILTSRIKAKRFFWAISS